VECCVSKLHETYTFSSCAWTPGEPGLNVGEAAFFFYTLLTKLLLRAGQHDAWWPFDEASGPIANDIAGTVNNIGTYQGSPTPVAGMVSQRALL